MILEIALDPAEQQGAGTPRFWPRAWLDALTDGEADQLRAVRQRGDAMAPALVDGDLVLIDRGARAGAHQDAIWLTITAGAAALRRVRFLDGDRLELLADNPAIPARALAADAVTLLGQLCAVVRRG
ncbi:S24 family peptidase [Sphingomonas morindae]|uniref:S24 family peptidase n=1 Tax=Sphingomonas morindae TaxID=1541170 RepID=A0ABY4XCY7_9SPHN|nr:S24 family peptidase [Sphingomonas morindae]USI74616.1 S24 family peptidase [Sphingomonas morindae]